MIKLIKNQIKIFLSKIVSSILLKINFSNKYLNNLLLKTLFKSENYKQIEDLYNNEKDNLEKSIFYEKVLRFESLEESLNFSNKFDYNNMISFNNSDKYKKLINFSKTCRETFPDSFFIHDRIAKNFAGNCDFDSAIKYFNLSLKIQRKLLNKKKKIGTIILASNMRSGGGWLTKSLSDGLNLNRLNIPYFDSWFPKQCIIDFPDFYKQNKCYEMKEGLWSGHIPAFDSNLINLSFLTDKVIVNFRDPRQQLISFYYSLERFRLGGNYTALLEYKIPKDYFFWKKQLQYDWLIKNWTIPITIEWIKNWLDVPNKKNNFLDILFINQKELAEDQKKVFCKILNFYNIPENLFTFPEKPKFEHNTHLRSGGINEWKNELEEDQIKILNNNIPEKWFKDYAWDLN